jgi:hypothetical protein
MDLPNAFPLMEQNIALDHTLVQNLSEEQDTNSQRAHSGRVIPYSLVRNYGERWTHEGLLYRLSEYSGPRGALRVTSY